MACFKVSHMTFQEPFQWFGRFAALQDISEELTVAIDEVGAVHFRRAESAIELG